MEKENREKKKFEKECFTVKQFFTNQNIDWSDYRFISNKPEPCDVYCEETDEQFQITAGEHEFEKDIHITLSGKQVEQIGSIDEIFEKKIVKPILSKINGYGGNSAKNIVLLVCLSKNIRDDRFLNRENYLKQIKKQIGGLENNYFQAIYIVCPSENIEICNKKEQS